MSGEISVIKRQAILYDNHEVQPLRCTIFKNRHNFAEGITA